MERTTGAVGVIGVAISTTGEPHRMGFLETSIRAWRKALPLGSVITVTVDGDIEAVARAGEVAAHAGEPVGGTTWQVGQPHQVETRTLAGKIRDGRQGVAVNKNTGIEILMDSLVEHLFLCDDDTWPLAPAALEAHIGQGLAHSMVCWGRNRQPVARAEGGMRFAEWGWPRGVLLYQRRSVIDTVGGMVEAFGPGGHEHVEFSRRIHQAGLTPAPFVTPAMYVRSAGGIAARGAESLWNCEDMPRRGEPIVSAINRKRRNTTVRREDGDWEHIERLMAARDGDASYVPFRAHANGRLPATLFRT